MLRIQTLLGVAAMQALLAVDAMSQESAPTSRSTAIEREAGVLEVLNEIAVCSSRVVRFHETVKSNSKCGEGTRPFGPFPDFGIVCRFSDSSFIDVTLAREHACKLFEAYGVTLRESVAIDGEGIHGVLDGYSETSRLGFEISESHRATFFGARHFEEPADRALTADEVARFEADKRRILHASRSAYPAFDGDEVLVQAYWAAAVIEFLNDAVDGPDVDLGTALWGDYQLMELGPPCDAATGEVLPTTMSRGLDEPRFGDGLYRRTNLHRPKSIRFTIGSTEKHQMEAWGRTSRGARATETPAPPAPPVATKGHISGLAFAAIVPSLGTVGRTLLFENFFFWNPVRLEQVDGDGRKRSIEALGPRFFAPSWFDAARPFMIEVTLPVGSHPMPSHIAVTR